MISVLRSLAFVRRGVTAAMSICAAVISHIAFAAAQCPFDNGASDAVNDGVVLTRYALGITGAPLVASTKYASLDPLQVKNNIECVGCALDMNGDGAIDTVDTTIIARHLSGFTGASLTAGLALGVGSRNSTAAVTSFLASGCALGGAINAWTLGGNAFGVAGVIGSTDAFPVTLQSGGASANVLIPGGNGLRILGSSIASAPNVVNGSSANAVAASPGGATVAGGLNNTASGSFAVVVGGGGNTASAHGSFIGGGGYCCDGVGTSNYPNTVTGRGGSVVGGYQNSVAGAASFIGGGYLNNITGNEFVTYASSVVGGFQNTVSGNYATVGGGSTNTVSADSAVVAGGLSNTASAPASSVSGGAFGKASLYGQTANAAGGFSDAAGTAQATQYVLRNRTTTANTTYLFLDGATQSLVFEPGRAGLMDVQVVAFAEGTALSASYAFRCHYAAVVGGGTILPVGCNKNVVYEGESAWDANVTFAPSATTGFGIAVNGAVGRNIRWVATVRSTEVSLQ
jgi:hypothetical protein